MFGALLNGAQESGVVRGDVGAEDVQAVVVAALAAQRYRNDDGRIADLILVACGRSPGAAGRSGAGVGLVVDFLQAFDGDVGVQLGGGHAGVAEEFLYHA